MDGFFVFYLHFFFFTYILYIVDKLNKQSILIKNLKGELVMKKIWVSLGILLVASVAVYGVVASVSASSVSTAVSVESCQSAGECPIGKQTAAVDSGCCAVKTADSGNCAVKTSDSGTCKVKTAQTASADGACCSSKAKSEESSQTAMSDGQ